MNKITTDTLLGDFIEALEADSYSQPPFCVWRRWAGDETWHRWYFAGKDDRVTFPTALQAWRAIDKDLNGYNSKIHKADRTERAVPGMRKGVGITNPSYLQGHFVVCGASVNPNKVPKWNTNQ